MTEVHHNQVPQYPTHPPTPEKKKRRWILPVSMLAGGLILGGVIGGSQVPEPIVQTKIETKKVEVTPEECITALDLAADLVKGLSEGPGIMAKALTPAYERDAEGIAVVTRELETAKADLDKLKAPLSAAVSVCRASAE